MKIIKLDKTELIPKIGSVITALNLRNHAWEKIKNNPDLSYEEVKYLVDYVQAKNKFIRKRCLTKKQLFEIKKDWRTIDQQVILKKYKISKTTLFKVINFQIL